MHFVIDDKIPYIKGVVEQFGTANYLPGAAISHEDVREADVLIVRTRTRVDRNLLEGTKVRFVATATIGFDHIDTAYLAEKGIEWTNCPGCNARSVRQYVKSALLLLDLHRAFVPNAPLIPLTAPIENVCPSFSNLTIGIVGVGHVGTEVANLAEELGFGRILLCDPPRAEKEGNEAFTDLERIAREADVITFHTPLTRESTPYPTFHLADSDFFEKLRPSAVIMNTARGEVVDNRALLKAIESGKIRTAVIDTWENEPEINTNLLSCVFIGTPHIAGYSADGKAKGTRMTMEAIARKFGWSSETFERICPPELPEEYAYYPEGEGARFYEALRRYDPSRDDWMLRKSPDDFERLRGDYPLRREETED